MPFHFALTLIAWTGELGVIEALRRESYALATAMNLALPAAIGTAAAAFGLRLRTFAGAALAMALLTEATQLTGTWGVYPCAIRQFSVDDLILNTAGAVLGFWVARRWQAHRPPQVRQVFQAAGAISDFGRFGRPS